MGYATGLQRSPVAPVRTSSLLVPFAGYAVALAMMLSVAVVSIHNLGTAATDWFERIKTREHHVTLAERMRWQSTLQVAAARAFIITADPVFRRREQEASDALQLIQRDLQRSEEDARANKLLTDVSRAAAAYDRAQSDLFAMRAAFSESSQIIRKFERELLPLRRSVDAAIDRYLSRQHALLFSAYSAIENKQARTQGVAIATIVLAGVLAGGLVSFMSRALARMYHRERAALERAEAAVGARDEMLGIVAHDLRTPLSAITMRAALLGEARDAEGVRRHAGFIESVATRMEHLIATLLDVASMDAGKLSIARAHTPVEPVMRDTVSMFAPAVRESIAIECSVREAGLAFDGDRERVLEVLSNLVGNAVKFTPKAGTIRLAADREGDFILFSISDTGPGIEPEHLPHVFDRFWKQDGPTSKGTGLGLFISKSIIEAHGGRIWAESRLGAGATFQFTLPSADPAKEIGEGLR